MKSFFLLAFLSYLGVEYNNGYGGDVGRCWGNSIYIDAVWVWMKLEIKNPIADVIWLFFEVWLVFATLPEGLMVMSWVQVTYDWTCTCPVSPEWDLHRSRERERLILITGHKFIDYILSGGITRILLRRLFLTIWLGCQETDSIDLVLAFLLSFVFRFGSNGNGIPFFDQQKLQLRWAPTRNGVISPL